LAAATESNLLPTLEATLPTQQDVSAPRRLAQAAPRTRRQSLLTLLFLGVVGLHRPWDLRGYAQLGLALLSTRRRAYGYRTAERFLSQVAQAGGAESFTDALARWATQLWKSATEENQPISPPYYVDGHRKPVFSDYLLPRGVIGRSGKVLGCRALLLLHDAQGHPRLSTTHRGDLHLTQGTPSLLSRYEAATDEGSLRRLVIDRKTWQRSSWRSWLPKDVQWSPSCAPSSIVGWSPLATWELFSQWHEIGLGRSSAKWPQRGSNWPCPSSQDTS
jgi:hypothetical protein